MLRDGQEGVVPSSAVLVGDIVLLDTGDKIQADGLVFLSHGLVADEASLTGESEPQHKGKADPWCLSGTQARPPPLQTFPHTPSPGIANSLPLVLLRLQQKTVHHISMA